MKLLFIVVAGLQCLVTEVYSSNNNAPKITLAPRSKKVAENSIVSFLCKASGNPLPRFTWEKKGKNITNRNRYIITNMPHGSVLRISGAKAGRDDHIFTCVATSEEGEPARAHARLTVYPTKDESGIPSGYPRITFNPTLKSVEKDRITILECAATGDPPPQIMWLKDLVPVDMTDPRLTLLEKGALQIERSQESDNGKYECVAENSVGVAYSYPAMLYIRVRKVPPRFTIHPEDVEIMPGSNVNLTCVAVGSPMPNVKWREGAHLITPDHDIPIGRNILMLEDVRESKNYTCVALSELGNIETHAEVKVKALPIPPIRLAPSEVTATSVKLSWSPGDKNHVKSYIVLYRALNAQEADYKETDSIRKTSYTLKRLEAFTQYELRVVAVNNVGRGDPSQPIEVKTGQLAPGSAPRSVRAKTVSASTIVVQWDEPEIPNGVIQGYKIFYTKKPDLPLLLWTQTEIPGQKKITTIQGLDTNETYYLSMLAYSSVGQGPISDLIQVKTIQGDPEVPDLVRNVHVKSSSPNELEINWDKPYDSDGIESYELYYNDSYKHQKIHISIKPPVEKYKLLDLTPDTVYHIQVAAKSSHGESSRSAVIQGKTLPFVPGEPKKVKVEAINSTAVYVQWRPPVPSERNGIIRGYQVHYAKVNSRDEEISKYPYFDTQDGDRLDAVITGLDPDTKYSIQVVGYTRRGDGIRSPPRFTSTKGAVPSPPRNLNVHLIQEDPPTVRVTWQRSRETHGDLLGYRILWGRVDEHFEEEIMSPDQHAYEIRNLDKGATYEIRVYAKNDVDWGERAVENLKTPEGIPQGSPLNFTAIGLSETTVRLTWDLPARDLRNGDIVSYQITYHRLSDPVNEEEINVTDTAVDIMGLEMNTDYKFQIKAYTSKGAGPWSPQVRFRTFGRKPPAPKNVQVRHTSQTSIEVSWNDLNIPVAGYKIYYSMYDLADLSDWFFIDLGPYSVTEITGLEPRTSYAVKVQAKSIDGRYGHLSQSVITNPSNDGGEHVDLVENFRATTKTSREVKLAWNPPKRGNVNTYLLSYQGEKTYRENGKPQQFLKPREYLRIPGQSNSFVVVNLQPKMRFDFNISAEFSDGVTGGIKHLTVETLIEAPPKMKPPRVIGISAGIITLELSRASEKNGPLSHYILVVVPEQYAKKDPTDFTFDEITSDSLDIAMPATKPYIAARFEAGSLKRTFDLGNEQIYGSFINRPLNQDYTYRVFLRAYSVQSKLYTSSPFSEPMSVTGTVVYTSNGGGQYYTPNWPTQTSGDGGQVKKSEDDSNSTKNLLMIIVPVVGAFIILVIFGLIIFYYFRRKNYRKKKKVPTATLR